MLKLFKDGDNMAITTDCKSEEEFSYQFVEALTTLIEQGTYDSDWEVQLSNWLPQYTDLICAYRGYKTLHVEKRTVFIAGSRLLSDEHLVIEKMGGSVKGTYMSGVETDTVINAIGNAILVVHGDYRHKWGEPIEVSEFQSQVLSQAGVSCSDARRQLVTDLLLKEDIGYSSISEDGLYYLSDSNEDEVAYTQLGE